MCIEKFLALHAKSKDGYIKHLEELLLDGQPDECARCEHCKRVNIIDNMSATDDGYVCDTCLPAYDREQEELKEIAESDESDYQYAKRGY